jgi:prolyl oligopeptidase family protein
MNRQGVEKCRSLFLRLIFCLSLAAPCAPAREWTSADGKKLEADFISSTPDQVTLKRTSDGQVFTLPQSRFSADDQKWISQQRPAVPGAPGDSLKPAIPPTVAPPGKPGAPPSKPIEGPFAALITGDWALSEQGGLKFALYGGKDLSAAEKYPLVLVLHGRSKNEENGKQVGGWMKSFTKPENYSERPCFIVAPMSAQPDAGEGRGYNGKELESVLKLVHALSKGLPVDPKRIYICGHSMGGYGTLHVMAHEPRLFAAGIPVAGTSNGDDAAALQRKPVWLFNATDDKLAPVAEARNFAKLMKNSKPFKFTEPPTGGHGVVAQVFEDPETHKWLFEQRLK